MNKTEGLRNIRLKKDKKKVLYINPCPCCDYNMPEWIETGKRCGFWQCPHCGFNVPNHNIGNKELPVISATEIWNTAYKIKQNKSK